MINAPDKTRLTRSTSEIEVKSNLIQLMASNCSLSGKYTCGKVLKE
jgi:hypothetical protein